MMELLEKTKWFLNIETYDPKNESKASEVIISLHRFKKILPFVTITTATAFSLQGLLKQEPIMYMRVPDIKYGYEIIYVSQFFTLYLTVFAVLVANGFFIGVCGSLASQFRLLRFLMLREEGTEQMKEMVAYHNVLLE